MDRLERKYVLSETDFALLSLGDVAYIKLIEVEGSDAFGVYAADGTTMAVIENCDVAVAAVRQQDLEPLSVH